jgi:hypothetical protein
MGSGEFFDHFFRFRRPAPETQIAGLTFLTDCDTIFP